MSCRCETASGYRLFVEAECSERVYRVAKEERMVFEARREASVRNQVTKTWKVHLRGAPIEFVAEGLLHHSSYSLVRPEVTISVLLSHQTRPIAYRSNFLSSFRTYSRLHESTLHKTLWER